MKAITLVLSFSLFIASCSAKFNCDRENNILNHVEKIIESSPDSSLILLESIDKSSLYRASDKAKYSLLMSMALDKNYIDISSDSIIRPALEYYKHSRDDESMMKTYYYAGVVRSNGGDKQGAMEFYVKAEMASRHSDNYLFKGRIHDAKYHIYRDLFDISRSLIELKKSKDCFYKSGDERRYINSLISLSNVFMTLNEYDSAYYYLNNIDSYYEKLTDKQRGLYYANRLQYCIRKDSINLNNYIYEYFDRVKNKSYINWMVISMSYIAKNDFVKAKEAIDKCIKADDVGLYYYIKSEVYEGLGQYEEALDAYKEYVKVDHKSDLDIFRSDTKFVEERYISELKKQKYLYTMIIFILLAALFLGITYVVIERYRYLKKDKIQIEKEKIAFKKMYTDAEKEIEALSLINKNLLIRDRETLEKLDERLSVLNKFIASNISASYTKEAKNKLNELMNDKGRFIESTRLSFAISHPGFIEALVKYNLTDWEIGCCCLYAMGLRGKDIAIYLDDKHYYKMSSSIRKKLGMEKNSTNINIFIQNILHHSKQL